MPPEFPTFHQEVADAYLRMHEVLKGLPQFLGVRVRTVSPGRMVATIEAREELHNPFGSMHGGVIAGLVDHVLGAVLYPVIPRGHWAATTEFKLNYLAPVREGTVTAEASIISMTRRTAVVRVEVSNDGRAVCSAQGTVLIQAPRGS
jgi:uncharacterized protein (TIGR00369 family)